MFNMAVEEGEIGAGTVNVRVDIVVLGDGSLFSVIKEPDELIEVW